MGKNLPCPQSNSEPGPSPVGNRAPVSSVASQSCSSTAREADCWIQLFGVSPVSPAKSDLSLPLAISGWRESTEGICGSPLKPLQRITPTAFSGSALHRQARLRPPPYLRQTVNHLNFCILTNFSGVSLFLGTMT